jgi:putative ABC transport system permease protein
MNSATRVYLSTMQMSLTSIIAHKLRSFLTVLGVTIGIFSIIAAMTAVSALRSSIESGLSFLGANTFQFAKWPNIQLGGNDWAKYQKRHNITLEQAQRYQSLMEGVGAFVCLKAFNHQAQMVNGIHHTTPSYDLCGTNQYFLNANQYEIATGRNLTDADVALNSPVAVIGSRIVEKCFPTRDPLGQMLIMGGHPYRVRRRSGPDRPRSHHPLPGRQRQGELFGQHRDRSDVGRGLWRHARSRHRRHADRPPARPRKGQ